MAKLKLLAKPPTWRNAMDDSDVEMNIEDWMQDEIDALRRVIHGYEFMITASEVIDD